VKTRYDLDASMKIKSSDSCGKSKDDSSDALSVV